MLPSLPGGFIAIAVGDGGKLMERCASPDRHRCRNNKSENLFSFRPLPKLPQSIKDSEGKVFLPAGWFYVEFYGIMFPLSLFHFQQESMNFSLLSE